MNGIDAIFVINLERRKDRLAEFIDRIKTKTTLPLKDIILFKAIDGKNNLYPTKDIKYLCRNCDYDYQPGIIGCALSHYDIWRNISGSNYIDKALIFEDDAMIFNDIDPVKVWNESIYKNYPEDCDLLLLGKSMHDKNKEDMHSEDGIFTKKFKWPNMCPMGATAYVLSKRLAQKYIEFIDKFGIYRAIDVCFLDFFKTKTNPFLIKNFNDFKKEYFDMEKQFDNQICTLTVPDLGMSVYRLVNPIINIEFYYKSDIQTTELYNSSILDKTRNCPIIKIFWTFFWPGFSTEFNFFKLFIENHFNVELVTIDNPNESDIIFTSIFGENLNPLIQMAKILNKKLITFTGEQWSIRNKDLDLAIGFEINKDNNYMRLPLWFIEIDWFNVRLPIIMKNPDTVPYFWLNRRGKAKPRKKFCLFVCGDLKCNHRNKMFEKLHAVKHIDSSGSAYNNMKIPNDSSYIIGRIIRKVEFSRDYRFALCPENESHPGYCTEKILHAFASGCVPIYWGDPTVTEDFNEKAFINGNGKSIDEVIAEVMEVENNPEKWIEMASQPVFSNLDVCKTYENNLKKYLKPIIDSIV